MKAVTTKRTQARATKTVKEAAHRPQGRMSLRKSLELALEMSNTTTMMLRAILRNMEQPHA